MIETQEHYTQVGRTILAQLGGRRFLTMTGAYSLDFSDSGFSARLPARNGGRSFTVLLNANDLYNISILQMDGRSFRVIETEHASDVFAEALCETFERLTGLRTSLGDRR